MADMEDKISAILNDPQTMQQIVSMAQSLGLGQGAAPSPHPDTDVQIDPAMLQKLTGLANQGGIDKRQQALLGALRAYLSKDRVIRLERAMRAAKMAKVATAALGTKGSFFASGR